MQHWLLMFRPDTYGKVREHGKIGVREGARKRLSGMKTGDRFVTYLSRVQLLDGYGEITSEVFEEDTLIFASDKLYPYRCRVAFDKVGAEVPVGDILWFLDAFEGLSTTTPTNIVFCKGGVMEISKKDYETLLDMIQHPPKSGKINTAAHRASEKRHTA